MNKTKLALEIPLRYWEEFRPYCDFHYALCHEVLRNKEYAKRYAKLVTTELWLDNSFNELKRSVTVEELLKACDIINPTHIVLSETENANTNLHAVETSLKELVKAGIKAKTISTWRGGIKELEWLEELTDIVALPCSEPRGALLSRINPEKWKNYHFFGYNTLEEVAYFKPRSIDTSTPIRLAKQNRRIKFEMTRPKLPFFDPNERMTKRELKLAHENITTLTSFLR